MTADITPDFTLKTKKGAVKVVFDLEQVSHKEYDDFRLGKLGPEKDDELMARVTGLPAATLQAVPVLEYKRLLQAFFRKAQAPLADPS